MSDYGVTENGFELKRLDKIMEEVNDDLTKGFGFDTSQLKPSFLNTLIVTFCGQIADLWETAQESYYAKYPATASGLNLDNAVQLGGVTRQASRPTIYPLHITGREGVTVPAGIRVGSDTNPQRLLEPVEAFTFTRDLANAIKVRVVSTEPAVFTVTINGNGYSYSSKSGQTAVEILTALKNLITEHNFSVSVDEDNAVLEIKDDVTSHLNAFILTDNLTTTEITYIANFATEEDGIITLVNGSINQLIDNVSGLYAVNNYLSPSYGRYEETDAELRTTYVVKSYIRSDTMIDSISAEILENVNDIISVAGYQNDSNVTDEFGLPPHSFEMIVEGGDDYAIAEAILNRKAGGITAFGNTKIKVAGKYHDTVEIGFSRPKYLFTWLKVIIHGDPAHIAVDYDKLAVDSILAYAATMVANDDLYTQKLIEGLYGAVSGLSYVDILVAYSPDVTWVPKDEDFIEGNVVASIRDKVDISSSRIEVVFNADS